MARHKSYDENEVLEKAMTLFWQNGYESTSMQMLEKAMGINKFSIYSSFGSKKGLFLRGVECYRSRLSVIVNKLRESTETIGGIKQYFYDFVDFSRDQNGGKGCLVTNTANELTPDSDQEIVTAIEQFTGTVRALFADKLRESGRYDDSSVEAKADYLIISMIGLSSASRFFAPEALDHYIENTFINL